MRTIDIVFDGPPGPEAGRFVEVEDGAGNSLHVGDWIDRGDGSWALRIRVPEQAAAEAARAERLAAAIRALTADEVFPADDGLEMAAAALAIPATQALAEHDAALHKDWTLAFGGAFGFGSGLNAPLVPDAVKDCIAQYAAALVRRIVEAAVAMEARREHQQALDVLTAVKRAADEFAPGWREKETP